MLLQVVGDADTADIAADIDSVRIGRFDIEDRIMAAVPDAKQIFIEPVAR